MRRNHPQRTGIWRSPAFVRLWSASAISAGGDQVSKLALPIIAIGSLHAGPFQVGLLLTVEQLPQLLFPLFAGAWIDRLRKRSVLLVCDWGRAIVLVIVPIAAWFGQLSLPVLFVTGFIAGTFTTWYLIAWQSMLPLVVEHNELVPAASAINQVESITQIAGPVVGGGLVGLVGGPAAILLDAVSFAGSAVLIQQLPQNETQTHFAHPPLLAQIREGIRYIVHDPILRAIGMSGALGVLFFSIREPLLAIFLLDEKNLGAGRYGLIFTLAAVGYAIGSFLSGRVSRRVGVGNAIVWPHIGFGLAGVGIALAVTIDQNAVAVIALMLLLEGIFEPINNVNQLSLRLSLMPREMRGRLTSVVRFLIRGAFPIGALLGGLIGQHIGVQTGMWIAAIGPIFAMAVYAGSGVLRYRILPPMMEV